MAYIVILINGKPNTIEIMGLGEDGELFIEKTIQDGSLDPEFRKFLCSGFNWKEVLDLGQKMGWNPHGSMFERTLNNKTPEISNYEPSSWGDNDYKVFTAEDASKLADSLEKALVLRDIIQNGNDHQRNTILLTSAMTESEYKHINRNLSKEFLEEFIQFLRKGKFKFIWDD
jgi:hypothetical protein